MAKKKSSKKNNKTYQFIYVIIVLIVFGWLWRDQLSKAKEKYGHYDTEETEAAAPAQPQAQYDMVVEPSAMTSQHKEYPGFKVSFNSEHHVPNYVAWELTRDEAQSQNVARSNNFAPDSDIKGCPTLDDYRNSGYDRGHMAPAGDMKWDNEAMSACFSMANMAPQDHALNDGAWRTLEEKCRQWAVRDSAIVIICGPVLTDRLTSTIGDSRVSVPKRFFKVVLSPYTNPPRAIGFIMPNSNVAGGMQAAAVSVDSVEAVTGLDFFSVLPDDIENRIEAECNFPRWSRKTY